MDDVSPDPTCTNTSNHDATNTHQLAVVGLEEVLHKLGVELVDAADARLAREGLEGERGGRELHLEVDGAAAAVSVVFGWVWERGRRQ